MGLSFKKENQKERMSNCVLNGVSPKSCVHVLTLRTYECDLIWEKGLYRCD